MASIVSLTLHERIRLAQTVGKYDPSWGTASPIAFIHAAEQANQQYPDEWVILYMLGDKYQEVGEYGKMLPCCKRLVELRPDDIRSAYALATAYNLLTRAEWTDSRYRDVIPQVNSLLGVEGAGNRIDPELSRAALEDLGMDIDTAAAQAIYWFEFAMTLHPDATGQAQIQEDLRTLYHRFPNFSHPYQKKAPQPIKESAPTQRIRQWLDPTRLYNPRRPAGRLMYFWGSYIYPIVIFQAVNFCLSMIEAFLSDYGGTLRLVGRLLDIGLIIAILLIIIRRLKDLGKSGWYALWVFVPVVNLFAFLWLLFAEGSTSKISRGTIPPSEGIIGSPAPAINDADNSGKKVRWPKAILIGLGVTAVIVCFIVGLDLIIRGIVAPAPTSPPVAVEAATPPPSTSAARPTMILDAIRPTQVPVVLTPLVCTKFFQVTVDAANLRQGPGKQYKVVRVARKGENLEVTGQRSPAGWYPVRDTVGKAYWVSADLGKVLERNCRLP